MFSRFNADEMVTVLQRMATHTNNSSPMHPWVRPATGSMPAPTERMIAQAKYIASINLSAQDSFSFPLKTLPRPRGKSTKVIYTTYDLPRPDAAPHDTAMDAEGNVWYSDFTSQFIGKLDPRTGKVTDYPVPLARSGPLAQGGLQIVLDKQGRVYYGNMSQMQIVRLDPSTGKMETFKAPIADDKIGTGHLTMIDPHFQDVDGQLWINVAEGTEESGGTYHIDLAKNVWTKVTLPRPVEPFVARAYTTWWPIPSATTCTWRPHEHGSNNKIWMTDGKTLKTTWWDMTLPGAGCRRGHIDSQDRLWCGDFTGDGLAMFDPKTQKVTEWPAPTAGMWPYDAEFDDRAYTWFAGMESDLAVRFNPKTGEFVQYLLPHDTNVRHVDVQKSGDLSSLWLGDQHSNLIIHIEPLAPQRRCSVPPANPNRRARFTQPSLSRGRRCKIFFRVRAVTRCNVDRRLFRCRRNLGNESSPSRKNRGTQDLSAALGDLSPRAVAGSATIGASVVERRNRIVVVASPGFSSAPAAMGAAIPSTPLLPARAAARSAPVPSAPERVSVAAAIPVPVPPTPFGRSAIAAADRASIPSSAGIIARPTAVRTPLSIHGLPSADRSVPHPTGFVDATRIRWS